MSSSRYRSLLIGALCALMLSAAATAFAATTSSSSSSSSGTLTLSAKAKKSLAGQHAALRATRPATRHNASYALPETSGTWNFVTATGTLNFNGVLSIAKGKQSKKINSVTFTRPAKGNGQLTVKLAGKKVRLFTITGRPKVKQAATSETLSGMTAKLTKAGATRLNKLLGGSGFKTNQNFGSFTVTVSTSAVNGASATGAGAPGVTGASATGAGVQFSPDFRSLLDSAGLSAVPLVPASNGLPGPLGTTGIPGADGTGMTLPLAGGTATAGFSDGTLTGTIPLSGGLQLGNGQTSVSLTNPELTLGTGTEGSSLSFSVNGGPEVKAFDVDTSQLEQSTLPNGNIDLEGLLATLSSEGASSLNTALGQNVFTTGQPVGGLSVIVPNSQGS